MFPTINSYARTEVILLHGGIRIQHCDNVLCIEAIHVCPPVVSSSERTSTITILMHQKLLQSRANRYLQIEERSEGQILLGRISQASNLDQTPVCNPF